MEKAIQYIDEILGIKATITPIAKNNTGNLPFYITETYKLYNIFLFNTDSLLAELINPDDFTILQIEKQIDLIRKILNKKVILVLDQIASYNRKRLIEKSINFIIPGKQLFLPELLIDLRENNAYQIRRQKTEKLLPSTQVLLIYQILYGHYKWKLEEHSFKEIAHKFEYTPMAITNAIDNLKLYKMVDVVGEKEKFIRFRYERKELWEILQKQNLLVSPVLKTVFVNELPQDIIMVKTNMSALTEYSDLNPSLQLYFAIEKTVFYGLQKSNKFVNLNDQEGKYAIEVWKYNPAVLIERVSNKYDIVDPLSLYASLKDQLDERIQIGLEQIIKKYIW